MGACPLKVFICIMCSDGRWEPAHIWPHGEPIVVALFAWQTYVFVSWIRFSNIFRTHSWEICFQNVNTLHLLPHFFKDPDEFERIYEPLDVKSKKIHIVDSGLTFNLPYPLILRPQRGVDLIISFDFSARPSDSSPPFKVSSPSLIHRPEFSYICRYFLK